jgi:hypothetical protein
MWPAIEGNTVKNKLAVVALTVGLVGGAGAGIVLGVTQLSNAQTPTTPVAPADPGVTPAVAGPNEDASHEAGESAQREADEHSGKGGFGHHHGGSNEDPSHEAGESAQREAEEDAAKAAGPAGTQTPAAGSNA